jgi:hypothetical protein
MAESAFQIQYRQESIKGFEQNETLLRLSVTTEAVIKGNQATFLVADSGGAVASTRGLNGMIPARADNLSQPVATLTERQDLVRKTGFNVFASQGNQREIMQRTSRAVMNREIDQDIITVLNTATNDTGTAVQGSVRLFNKARVILGNNQVPWDGDVAFVCTPAFIGYLEQAPEFSNGAEYVSMKPFAGQDSNWADKMKAYRWHNAWIIEHPNLPGFGTSAEKCFLYHKSAIGHAMDTAGLQALAGYDEEQDYSWARTTAYMGAVLLQNAGVVVVNHDGSGFIAT